MEHCIARIAAIVERGEPSPKALFQLGYNLGRLSELTGLGRERFWDRWKDAVIDWDRPSLEALARELLAEFSAADGLPGEGRVGP